MSIMTGFPPKHDDVVTLRNWRIPPHSTWAFQHVRELIPSVDIPNDPERTRRLEQPSNASQKAAISGELGAAFASCSSDSVVVLHHGALVYERYGNGMAPSAPHIWMSVSKSVLGILFGVASRQGIIAAHDCVADIIPELRSTAYDKATLRDLLDMRVGVKFLEDYEATGGPIIEYRKAQGWNPLEPGEKASDLRTFLSGLNERDGVDGARFHYVSPNTDLLGWAIERASGRRYADLVSDLIWKPIGAGNSAYITVDRVGAPRCAGGFCCTTRDMALLGQLVVDDGSGLSGQVLPAGWVDSVLSADTGDAWKTGDFWELFERRPMHYRAQWYVIQGEKPLAFGIGVFGQYLFVDASRALVVATTSSEASALDPRSIAAKLQGVERLRQLLG